MTTSAAHSLPELILCHLRASGPASLAGCVKYCQLQYVGDKDGITYERIRAVLNSMVESWKISTEIDPEGKAWWDA